MKRVRGGIPVGMALVALVMGVPAISASQLNLLPLLQISGQYTDNVYFENTNKRSDTFFLVNPGIALDYASKTFVGSIAYQLGMQRYVDFNERDNNVHRVDASVGFKVSSGWAIDAGDNLYVTSDPLAFDASGDRIQRDSFTYNRFTPAVSYNFSGHNVQVMGRYDRIDINYDHLTDSYQNGFGFNASTKIGARSTLGFDFFEFKRYFDQQRPELNVVDYTGRRYGARVDRRISPRFSANGYVGYEDRKFRPNPSIPNYNSVIFEGNLIGDFPEVVSWTVGVSQRLNDLAIRGAYRVRRFNYDLRKSIRDRLRLEFNGFVQNSNNRQIPEKVDFFGMRLEGQYMVARFLNVWLGYDYLNRDSPDINPFTQNTVNFGLTLSYGL